MAVTPASFVARYPQWEQVNTNHPTVVTESISVGENRVDETVVGDRYDEAVMLAASSWLFEQTYARDMMKPDTAVVNIYENALVKLLKRKGGAYRTVWDTNDFGVT
jgi:hypothetical protein